MSKYKFVYICLFILTFPVSSFCWSEHHVISEIVFSADSKLNVLPAIQSKPIDVFLKNCAEPVAQAFSDYYVWLANKGSKRFKVNSFDPKSPTVTEFIRAARLNPSINFTLKEVAEKSASVAQITPVKLLSLYSDEPDWGMDDEVWEVADYGFGKAPYGGQTGDNSNAAFHMQFLHEDLLLRIAAPEIKDGMADERIELFTRLSKVASSCGDDYWKYRFKAWALHYIQDLSQLYHAKASPSSGWFFMIKYLFSNNKAELKQSTSQLMHNRHFLFEDFAAYSVKNDTFLKDCLLNVKSGVVFSHDNLVYEVTKRSSSHAKTIDELIVGAFGVKLTEDSTYDLSTDKSFKYEEVHIAIPRMIHLKLLDETCYDMQTTSSAMRVLVED